MPSQQQHIFLFILLLLAVAVYYLDAIAQVNFLYWTFWWYDIMMHFLGGLVVSGIGLWTFVRFTSASPAQTRQVLYVAIGTAMAIGISWEFFEYVNGMYVGQSGIVADTITDLLMDFEGSAVMGLIIRLLLTRRISTSYSS